MFGLIFEKIIKVYVFKLHYIVLGEFGPTKKGGSDIT